MCLSKLELTIILQKERRAYECRDRNLKFRQAADKIKNGDDCAFSELVETHWEKIYNRANSLLSNHQDAEEVAQDTFLRARKSIGNFRGDCSISTWLYHIATNLARNKHWYWWRRKRSESVSLESSVGENEDMRLCDVIAEECDSPADEAESNEFAKTLPAAIAALPENTPA